MKRISSLIFIMLCAVGMYAESVPHAVFFNSSGKLLFTYAEAGTYKSGTGGVSAVYTGDYVVDSGSGTPAWYNWNGNVTNVVFDPSFASARPQSTANWFHDCNKLTSIVGMKEYLNTSEVTNMSHMFYKCTVIESIDVSGFNTSNVTDMSYMFANCLRLWNLDVSNFNTSEVKNMSHMFQNSSLNSLNLSNFNTSKVENMCMMFNDCSNITSLDLSSFDTSNVTDMSYMFANCILLRSLDVSNFNTSKVTNMECMFFGFFLLSSLDVSNFNTSSVTNMCKMFSGSNFSELDLSNFDTSNVTNMQEMFSSAGALEKLDLSNFNTSKVTNMKNMFNYCTSLTTLNLTTFNTSSVTNMDGMFMDCSALTTIYCSDSWNAENSTNMFYGCTSLVGASAYNSNNVTVAYANPTTGYFSKLSPHVIWCADKKTLYFLADGQTYAAGEKYKGQTISMVWDDRMGAGSGIITATGMKTPSWKACSNDATTVIFEESFAYVRPTSTWEWFLNFKNLTTITGLENLNTSATEYMYCMFTSCESLSSIDISTFDMSSVKSMMGMFGYCNKLETVNLGSLDMSGVSTVPLMFAECPELTTIYCDNAWNFTDEDSKEMFVNCPKLVGASGVAYDANNINASYANPTTGYFTWTKSNVLCFDNNTTFCLAATDRYKVGDTFDGKTISSVWGLCDAAGTATPIWQAALKSTVTNAVIDESFADERPKYAVAWFEKFENITGITGLSNLNTSEVTDMRFMFADCVNLSSLDFSTFNMAKVKDVTKMFLNCSSLTTIYCNYNWNENTSIVNSTDMFLNCTNLVGTVAYDKNNVTVAYANPTTGYFTWTKSNVFCCDNNTTFYLAATANYRVGDTFKGKTISSVWGLCDAAGTATPIWQKALKSTVTKAVIDESFADERPKYAVAWFENFTNLTQITGLSNFNTSEVTGMQYLFSNCVNLEALDLSTFNTENVKNMAKMFRHCEKLSSLNLSNWDTSNLTDMNYMFQSCRLLPTPDLSHFNTSAVTNMSGAFVDCQAFTTLDLSTFNTSNVTTMRRMFDGCKATSLNLYGFDVSKVTEMYQMFRNCDKLTTIFSDDTWSCNNSTGMFLGCTKLVGGNGTTCDGSNNIDVTYARLDSQETPGYFSLIMLGDINLDGSVDISDVVLLVNIVLGNREMPSNVNCDLNDDESVDISDIVKLVNMILGTDSSSQSQQVELLTNGVSDGTFNGWTIEENGGSGWVAQKDETTGEGYWQTSYELCTMSQTVTLATKGITDEDIDNGKVTCDASADMRFTYDNYGKENGARVADVIITMLDESGSVLKTMTVVNKLEYFYDWQTFTASEELPVGTRQLKYTVRGQDVVGWSGYYGPCFKNLSMKATTTN